MINATSFSNQMRSRGSTSQRGHHQLLLNLYIILFHYMQCTGQQFLPLKQLETILWQHNPTYCLSRHKKMITHELTFKISHFTNFAQNSSAPGTLNKLWMRVWKQQVLGNHAWHPKTTCTKPKRCNLLRNTTYQSRNNQVSLLKLHHHPTDQTNST